MNSGFRSQVVPNYRLLTEDQIREVNAMTHVENELIDEADIESHAYYDHLCRDPRWASAFLERVCSFTASVKLPSLYCIPPSLSRASEWFGLRASTFSK